MFPRIRITSLFAALAALGSLACSSDGGPTGPDGATSLADHTADACEHDVVAPSISSVSADPSVLWPPNHKMVPVSLSVAASDNCSAVTTQIIGVTSNEPVNGLGDGNTAPDWEITGPLTLMVRSERSGLGTGRVYTITVQSTDAAGNSSTAATTVSVPHDQGKMKE